MPEKNQNLCLLYGKDTYFLENALKKKKKDFGTLVKGINFITIDQTNVNVLLSEIETPAFGYEKKFILARDTALFKKSGKKAKTPQADWMQKIVEYLEEHKREIQDSVELVFVEEEVEKNELYKWIEKNAVIQNYEEEKPAQLVNRLKQISQAYEVKADNATMMYLIEVCGTNMQELINEIRKLIEYAGKGGTITKEAIDLLCIRKIDVVIFQLTDCLGKKEIRKSFGSLKRYAISKRTDSKNFNYFI